MVRIMLALGVAGLLSTGLAAGGAVQAQSRETVLTEAVRDFDGNGVPDTLAIVMLEGRRTVDRRPWCGRGEKYRGDFEIRVRGAGRSPTTHPLTSYSFFRAGDWTVSFADYNGDGRIDFNLGQYASCNGWRYELFTVDAMGRVDELEMSGAAVPVSDFGNSTDRIVVIPGGIEHCYYHSGLGHLVGRYRWSKEEDAFLTDGERSVERCPPH